MNSIYYALTAFAILYVIWWCTENERDDSNPDGSKGLFAMRPHGREPKRGGSAESGRRFRAPSPDGVPTDNE